MRSFGEHAGRFTCYKKYVDLFRNPTSSEMLEIRRKSQQTKDPLFTKTKWFVTAALLTSKDAYVWDKFDSDHYCFWASRIGVELDKLSRRGKRGSIYVTINEEPDKIWFKRASVFRTGSKFSHSKRKAERFIKRHPYIRRLAAGRRIKVY